MPTLRAGDRLAGVFLWLLRGDIVSGGVILLAGKEDKRVCADYHFVEIGCENVYVEVKGISCNKCGMTFDVRANW